MKKSKMDGWTMLFLICIFIGSLGGVLFSIKQYYSSQEDQREIINNFRNNALDLKEKNDDLKNQLIDLKKSNDILTNALELRDKKLSEQNTKIEDLNNKIFEKSEFIQNTLFGKGFCYVMPAADVVSHQTQRNVTSYFTIINDLEFPLYNVSIEIFDFNKLKNKIKTINGVKSIDTNDYKESLILTKNFTEINANSWGLIEGLEIDYLNTTEYYIKILHRNGKYWQRIFFHLETKDKNIYVSTEVFDTKKAELVYSQYLFPKGKEKNIKDNLNKINLDDVKIIRW